MHSGTFRQPHSCQSIRSDLSPKLSNSISEALHLHVVAAHSCPACLPCRHVLQLHTPIQGEIDSIDARRQRVFVNQLGEMRVQPIVSVHGPTDMQWHAGSDRSPSPSTAVQCPASPDQQITSTMMPTPASLRLLMTKLELTR